MHILELTLQNFGPYHQWKIINLQTQPESPIILFGGMNSGGKTTLMDANGNIIKPNCWNSPPNSVPLVLIQSLLSQALTQGLAEQQHQTYVIASCLNKKCQWLGRGDRVFQSRRRRSLLVRVLGFGRSRRKGREENRSKILPFSVVKQW
jgi:predicted ATPase